MKVAGDKARKVPESKAQKKLREIQEMEERNFKNLQLKLNSRKSLTASETKRLENYREQYEALSGVNLPDHIVTSKRAVGEFFGKTRRTIINWSKRWGPKCKNQDGYSLPEIENFAIENALISARISKTKQVEVDPSTDNDGNKSRAYYEREIKRLDSELKALKLEKERGDLIPRAMIAREWTQRVREVTNGLDYLYLRLPSLLDGLTQIAMSEVIQNETWKLRDNFSRTGRFCPSPGEQQEGVEHA